MDRTILKQYDALCDERDDIAKRIEKLNRELSQLAHSEICDTVSGTRDDGTYGPIKIHGIPMPEYEAKKAQLQKNFHHYEELQQKLTGMIDDIENFIDGVTEPRIRTILRMRYIDGRTWREIGRHYGKAHQWAYNKIERYFE